MDVSKAQLESDSVISNLQAGIRNLFSKLFTAQDLKAAQSTKIKSLEQAIIESRDLLLAEISLEYPGADISIIETLNLDDPLYIKYRNFEIEAQSLSKQMEEEAKILEDLEFIESDISSKALSDFSVYQNFYSVYSDTTTLPSPQSFYVSIVSELSLPSGEQSSMLANSDHITGMDLANTDARAFVTSYLASGKTNPVHVRNRKRAITVALTLGALLILL